LRFAEARVPLLGERMTPSLPGEQRRRAFLYWAGPT